MSSGVRMLSAGGSVQAFQVLALLALLVRIQAGLVELVVGNRIFHLPGDQPDSFPDFGELARLALTPQFDARRRFIEQVDGAIGQMAVPEKPA